MSRARRRRPARPGAVMAEAALVMTVLLMFLMLAPAIWKQWVLENSLRADVHRKVFAQTSVPIYIPFDLSDPFGSPIDDIIDFLFGRKLEPVDPPNVSAGGSELTAYRNDFANDAVNSRSEGETVYSSGWSGFRGTIEITRKAALIRPTWTWTSYPFTHSQGFNEGGAIQDWFDASVGATLDQNALNGLKLDGFN